MSPGKLTTGTVFIILGVLFLMNNFGVLSWGVWFSLATLWPVLLIALGLGLIFKGSWLSLLGPLVILGAVGYAVANPDKEFVDIKGWSWNSDMRASGTSAFSRPLTEGVRNLGMDIDFGAGNLYVNGNNESKLYSCELEYRGRKPRETFSVTGDTAKAHISQRHGNILGPQDWTVNLTGKRPVDLSVDAGACKAELGLEGVDLSSLEVDCGASSLEVRLPMPKRRVEVDMNSGASSIDITLPKGAQARIRIQDAVASSSIDESSFRRDGKYWVTPGYHGSSKAYDIDISNGVGSVNVDVDGGGGGDWEAPESIDDGQDV